MIAPLCRISATGSSVTCGTISAILQRLSNRQTSRRIQWFIDNLSRPLIDQLHAAGYLVDGSVINSKERMKTALEIGCDMVESDTPDQAIAWYRELTEETERHA